MNKNENKEKEEKFEFLDDKCKDLTFYKVLMQNLSNPDIYNNTGWSRKVIDYELHQWFTEEEAPLDRSTQGIGFYSYKSLKGIIRDNSNRLREFITGERTVHPVVVKEVCGIDTSAVRSRMVKILPPLTFDAIIEQLTEWDETTEEMLEKYMHYTSELDRFSAVKMLLEEKAKEKERGSLLESCRPIADEYWAKYNKYKPFFERLEMSKEVFVVFEIPSDYKRTNISFHNYDSKHDYSHALAKLNVALSFLKDVAYRQARSIQVFIPRMKKRLVGIEEKALKEKEHINGLLETYKDLLSDIPELGEEDGTYTLSRSNKLRRIGRKQYDFQLSHVSTGKEPEEDIFELQ